MYSFLNRTPAQYGGWVGILLALSGCQSGLPSTSLSQQEQQQRTDTQLYAATVQQVLHRESLRANREKLMGSVELVMKFDRQNQVISCEAQSSSAPSAQAYPYNPKLGEMVKAICWNAVFPLAPATAFEPDGVLEVKGTLMFPPLTLESEQLKAFDFKAVQYAQSHFFWEQAVAGTGIDSIGVASFHYTANAQGQVQECLVNLERSEFRPEAFKADAALRQHLTQRCQQLDLRQMPDFVSRPNHLTRGEVLVEYMPWRGGPQPR